MPEVGFFSTDWTTEPVIDPIKSQIEGRPVAAAGKQMATFGGTFYYRGAMPAMELAKHGWDPIITWRFRIASDGHWEVMDKDGEWHSPELIYTQRWMHHDGANQVRQAQAAGQKIIADLDDDFWALGKTNIAYHTTDPIANPDFNRDHYWNMIAACDAITVSTEALYKRVQKMDKPTYILRNAIDLERWPQSDPTTNGAIGWVGGIQWRAHDLHVLRSVGIAGFLEQYGLPFYHGGDSQVPDVPKFWQQLGIDPSRVKCLAAPLCHIAKYPALWDPINVSLIPLERVAFNQAKSYLKSLESCARGVPYVVSAGFDEQMLLIEEGSAGRVARNTKPSDWIGHLTDLLDPDVRRREGEQNRRVAELHNITHRWTDWDAVYAQIMGVPAATVPA